MKTKKNYGYNYSYSPQMQKKKTIKWDSSYLLYVLAVTLIIFTIVGYVALQTKITNTSFSIERLTKKIASLEKSNNRYKLTIAEKTNLRHVEERARKEIGMIKAQSSQYVYLTNERALVAKADNNTLPRFSMVGLFQNFRSWFKEKTVVAAGALGD